VKEDLPGNFFITFSIFQKPTPNPRGWRRDHASPYENALSELNSRIATPMTANITEAQVVAYQTSKVREQ